MEGLFIILKIVGALATFIYGMKVMSEGIQRVAGAPMRNIFKMVTKNRFIGVFTGFVITGLVQSSSATTVLTVSFVNAGLLSLVESAGIMMGANVGTSITGWLVAMGVGRIDLADFSLPLMAIGLPLLLLRKGKSKFLGEILIGFALLFLGLNLLQATVPDLKSNSDFFQFLTNYTNLGFTSTLIFVGLGAVLTGLVQSSSAAMAFTLVMLIKDWIPIEIAAAMILGENIGTTITAELASLVGNVHAKRAARVHSLFNIVGVSWMVLALPYFLEVIQKAINSVFSNTLFADQEALTIAAFHTVFNLCNVILLIGFVPWLVKLAHYTVRSRGEEDESYRLAYINSVIKTPELSMVEAQRALVKYGELTARMLSFTDQLLFSTDQEEQQLLIRRIKKYEEITDRLELELIEYLTKLSADELAMNSSVQIRNILSVCNHLENIGDIFYQIARTIERKIESRTWFVQQQRERLKQMLQLLDKSFQETIRVLSSKPGKYAESQEALHIKQELKSLRELVKEESAIGLQQGEYNTNSIIIYNDLSSSLETISEHLQSIMESLVGGLKRV